MTTAPNNTPDLATAEPSKTRKAIVWVAISAMIISAIICVFAVLFGTEGDIVRKAFTTVGLLTLFAFAVIVDTRTSYKRPDWLNLISMGGWIVLLLAGAFKIWAAQAEYEPTYFYEGARFTEYIGLCIVVRLAILHFGLMFNTIQVNKTSFNLICGYLSIAFVALLGLLLSIPLITSNWDAHDEFYWRGVVAVSILAALGTALVPLVNALTRPAKPANPMGMPETLLPWPTYADGTPLPMLPNGMPDFNALNQAPGYGYGYPQQPLAYGQQAPAQPVQPQQPASGPTPPPAV